MCSNLKDTVSFSSGNCSIICLLISSPFSYSDEEDTNISNAFGQSFCLLENMRALTTVSIACCVCMRGILRPDDRPKTITPNNCESVYDALGGTIIHKGGLSNDDSHWHLSIR